MDKVPVGQTISESYAFAFGNYLKLLGITWLPLLVTSIASFFFLRSFAPDYLAMLQQMPAAPGTPPVNPFAGHPIFQWILPLDIVMLLLMVMMTTGITKEILGLRTGPNYVYLSFGSAELRMIAAFILLFVILFVGIIIVSAIAGFGAVLVAAGHGGPGATPSAIAGVLVPVILILYLVAFYFFIRLSFFVAPAVVAESGIGIGRSWRLSSGNFWRIFAVGLAIWIPLLVVEFVVLGAVMAPGIVAAMSNAQNNPQAIPIAFMKSYFDMMPYMMVVFFFIAPIVYGLILAPAAFAYRALVPARSA